MPSAVFDASSLVGALLKAGSVPERALLLARSTGVLCLSDEVEREIEAVFSRAKFSRYLTPGRAGIILNLIVSGAFRVEPTTVVTDCRDAKDNKYLELALAAGADTIVASDEDLLVLNPWRGIPIVTPADYVQRFQAAP
jgi:putative PIN family toxin of toxin-antitoxin system